MVQSMTAFARSELHGEWGTLSCELRSVNHRYLDISLRLPEELRAAESAMRERLQAGLSRGKVECALRYQAPAATSAGVEVDHATVRALLAASAEVETLMGAASQYTALEVLRWPGVVREPKRDLAPLHTAAQTLVNDALDAFIATRQAEGTRLAELIRQRAAAITQQLARVRSRRKALVGGLLDKYRARLADLGVEAEPGRLEQELAIAAQRLDVDEELDRLDSHLTELHAVLDRDEPIGRRLDFLMQEFNREANTLGSKSADIETTQAAVELKVLIEQMREQIQNIE
ncbi:YicC/YloC family endoribonuclease [Acidihalobacter ferrooxydans]|uniref:YicC family protein n=1 Tax=Acidihalobacter ferrooxydans TaxID=1765967 RepID=A0A1P8UJL2_9GAMM|nr:YicC/YloC family endoribonuclease [Acidihalobacter ferrooxydans]APZ44028.1 YicC family protein [Acidihalobacter ferrooxydans]